MDEFGNLCGEGGARRGLLHSAKAFHVAQLLHGYEQGFGVRASAHVRLHEVSDNEAGYLLQRAHPQNVAGM